MVTTDELKINVTTLTRLMAKKTPVTILDVRPKSEREEWWIPGSIHADVYDKLKNDDQEVFDHLKLDIQNPVITVCAAGKTSMKAALILKDKGYEVYSLDGGMKAWNFAWNTAETIFHDVKIVQIRRSSKGCLSYVIGSEGEAIAIDASLDPRVYMDIAKENGWTIKYVTDTHIHADYLSRTRELARQTGAKHLLIDSAAVEYTFTPIKNGETIKFGNASMLVIHTPGHTLESTSFKLSDDAIFTGDTLFVDGVGRPDLKADQDEAAIRANLLYQSLFKLTRLSSTMLVFPAHLSKPVSFDGVPIAEPLERLKNKLEMLKLSKEDFVQYTLSRIPPAPPNYITIATLNKQGSYEGYNPAELEAGANRCAVS